MQPRLEEWWQCSRIGSSCRHSSRTFLACSECRSNSSGRRRREWSKSHRDLLQRLAGCGPCRQSFALMKEVVERLIIIHPSLGSGMLSMSNEEAWVGIMVFKLDQREAISPGEFAHSNVIDLPG